MIRYTHPNLLLISWKHWIPSYVRNEIKKKTGVVVDGYGNKIDKDDKNKKITESSNPNELMFAKNDQISIAAKPEYKQIETYTPTGNMIYNKDLLKRIEDRSK